MTTEIKFNNFSFSLSIKGDRELIQDCLQSFPMIKDISDRTECYLDGPPSSIPTDDININNRPANLNQLGNNQYQIVPSSNQVDGVTVIETCALDLKASRQYIERLERLIRYGDTKYVPLGGIYDLGFARLLTLLRDSGCLFESNQNLNAEQLKMEMNSSNEITKIWSTKDANICLSAYDALSKKNNDIPNKPSHTMILNQYANIVSRTILYGGAKEKSFIAANLEKKLPALAKRMNCDTHSQEIYFLRGLIVLLTEGLTKAESTVTMKNSLKYSKNKNQGVSSSPSSSSATISAIASSAVNDDKPNEVFNNITDAESEAIINMAVARTMSEMSVLSQSRIDYRKLTDDNPPYRLYGSYLNAFYRLVENCLSEIGKRADNVPYNEELILNVANWEKDLRVDLTKDNWPVNCNELVGEWRLVDVMGEGSLTAIMKMRTDEYTRNSVSVPVNN
jgi:hypothetical protein